MLVHLQSIVHYLPTFTWMGFGLILNFSLPTNIGEPFDSPLVGNKASDFKKKKKKVPLN